MKNYLLKTGVKLNNMKVYLLEKTRKHLNNDRGNGVIEGLIFTCFVILAIIAIRPQIFGVFSDIAISFRAWISQKTTEIFN